MVGIFSRFSASRAAHRRTQSALDAREVTPPNLESTNLATVSVAATYGLEVSVDFKPVEHPIEPLDNDKPIQCPLPEPSILNDGRIWKERLSTTSGRRPELAVMKEDLESEVSKTRRVPSNRFILPSLSAPEHNIVNLLEECNGSAAI